jgi:hypothetical protein
MDVIGAKKAIERNMLEMAYSMYRFGHDAGAKMEKALEIKEFAAKVPQIHKEGEKIWKWKHGG